MAKSWSGLLKSHKKGDPYGGPIFLQMEPSYVGNGQSLGLAYGSICGRCTAYNVLGELNVATQGVQGWHRPERQQHELFIGLHSLSVAGSLHLIPDTSYLGYCNSSKTQKTYFTSKR